MKAKTKTQYLGLLMVLFQFLSFFSIALVTVQASRETYIGREVDEPLMRDYLEGQTYTYEVQSSFGVYASHDIHAGNQFRIRVSEVDINNTQYRVERTWLNWTDDHWSTIPQELNDSIYVVPTDWGTLAREMIIPQNIHYFARHPKMLELYRRDYPHAFDQNLTGQEILNELNEDPFFWESSFGITLINFAKFQFDHYYVENAGVTFEYERDWYQGRFTDFVILTIYIDENNFDRLVYTREEGILISRTTEIYIVNGTRSVPGDVPRLNAFPLSGRYHVELQDFSRELVVSFWHYVIWFFIIFGSVLGIIFLVAFIYVRREKKITTMDY